MAREAGGAGPAFVLVATVLMEAGAEVETARSAADGLRELALFHPDVLVSDIGMPDEDGFSFVRKIRSLPSAGGARTPALAPTAFASESDRAQALAAGFTAYVSKPVEPDVLASAVSSLARLRQGQLP